MPSSWFMPCLPHSMQRTSLLARQAMEGALLQMRLPFTKASPSTLGLWTQLRTAMLFCSFFCATLRGRKAPCIALATTPPMQHFLRQQERANLMVFFENYCFKAARLFAFGGFSLLLLVFTASLPRSGNTEKLNLNLKAAG